MNSYLLCNYKLADFLKHLWFNIKIKYIKYNEHRRDCTSINKDFQFKTLNEKVKKQVDIGFQRFCPFQA